MNKRFLRYHYLRFKRLKDDPKKLAKGVTIGIFVGITPIVPLRTVLIFTLCFCLGGNAVGALIAAALVGNPLTLCGQYFVSWWIGSLIFPNVLSWQRVKEVTNLVASQGFASLSTLADLGLDAIMVVLCGGIILALPFTITAYYSTYRFFTHRRSKKTNH